MGSEVKHIVIVGPAYPLRGGLSTYNQLLATRLQEMGHEVQILTFCLQYPGFLFPGKTQFSEDAPPEHLNIDVRLNSINPLNWLREGIRLKKLRADLIIFRFWMPFMGPALGTLGRIARSNRHTRVVAITDNIIPHEKRPFDKLFTRYFLNACHGFVAMSRAVQQDLKSMVSDKPTLFNPHPMYESFGEALSKEEACRELGLNPRFKYLLFFGFIRKYKGLDLLLEAFAQTKVEGLKLIIAGEYYEGEETSRALIGKLGITQDLVEVNTFIPDSKVHLYFCAADMVVQPYRTATQSGVTQIAYYYNIPMLVTNVGGLAELVPEGKVGYVTEPEAESISRAIEQFYKDNKKELFAANIQKEKERFTWESMIEKLFEAANR